MLMVTVGIVSYLLLCLYNIGFSVMCIVNLLMKDNTWNLLTRWSDWGLLLLNICFWWLLIEYSPLSVNVTIVQ